MLFLGGYLLGSSAAEARQARERERNTRMAMMMANDGHPGGEIAQLKRDTERIKRETEALKLRAAALPVRGNGRVVSVIIPDHVQPGSQFFVQVEGRSYAVRCPPGGYPGAVMEIHIPEEIPVATAVPISENVVVFGKQVLHDAVESGSQVMVMENHIVDENDPEYSKHGIISVPAGTQVTLVSGSLKTGLGPPYSDYCLCTLPNGKTGKISRLVLQQI